VGSGEIDSVIVRVAVGKKDGVADSDCELVAATVNVPVSDKEDEADPEADRVREAELDLDTD
jgi:hypothetical protein